MTKQVIEVSNCVGDLGFAFFYLLICGFGFLNYFYLRFSVMEKLCNQRFLIILVCDFAASLACFGIAFFGIKVVLI